MTDPKHIVRWEGEHGFEDCAYIAEDGTLVVEGLNDEAVPRTQFLPLVLILVSQLNDGEKEAVLAAIELPSPDKARDGA